MDDTAALRHNLADKLAADGAIRSPEWRQAFLTVPRHLFAPQFWHRTTNGTREWIDGTDPTQHEKWLSVVYSDDSLVTQDGQPGTATSSSTQPSLMALMLEALDLQPGHKVLEIGTGTGYNTALLCHRLGDQQVITVEIDPQLADTARDTLAELGYRPTVIAGNGLDGYPQAAPYDRIIATCSTARIPTPWLNQTTSGGIVLANLGGGVVRLQKADDGTASGRFLPGFAGFIEARNADGPTRLTVQQTMGLCAGNPDQSQSAHVSPDYANEEWLVLASIALPDLTRYVAWEHNSDICRYGWADAHTRSWVLATHHPNRSDHVAQAGPRRLWDELEQLHIRWQNAGRPTHDRLGLTVHSDGSHELWIDRPNSEHRWQIAIRAR